MNRFAHVLLGLAGLVVPTVAIAASGDTAPFYSGLLVNGDFFNNTSPWIHSNPTTGEMQYSDVDFTGEVGSGSALIFNLSPNASGGDDAFQCVTGILPGETYSFGGNILLESNPTHTGYASLVISFFGSSNCQLHRSRAAGRRTSSPRRAPDISSPSTVRPSRRRPVRSRRGCRSTR
ncbi:MAG: hypothetical protein R2862_08050 [Thermoanaerobaculia bacterium]